MAEGVLVDGAGGFLGGHLVPTLLRAGLRVRATDLPGVPLDHLRALGAETAPSDLRDPTSLDRGFSFTVPLANPVVELIGRVGLALPDRAVKAVIDRLIGREWRRIKRECGLDPDFVLRFNKEVFSYFIGERAYASDRLVGAGFEYTYPSAALGMPPTIRWYVEHRWLPAPSGQAPAMEDAA